MIDFIPTGVARILIYGFGNPSRKDDALGVLFSEELEQWASDKSYKSLSFDANYQLAPEDAAVISDYDIVFFADASQEDIHDFSVERVMEHQKAEFSLHYFTPGNLAALCQELFHPCPEMYEVHIKGYEWQLEEGMTKKARNNLGLAVDFMKTQLKSLLAKDHTVSKNFIA